MTRRPTADEIADRDRDYRKHEPAAAISAADLAPIPHATTNEKLIVGKLVADLLAAGLTITIWNGGAEPELKDSTDAAKIFADLCASDQDELTMERDGRYAGWIRLVWGNDVDVISDYSTSLEAIMAPANALAEELDR
jgi:hypothetical protein